ncbi:hypothetical protein HXY32_02995 [Candidatus Bathyarchaeota archaeon]|nr:hypothetical protein [Candidatus Bathyarchaeota archaeon]
MPHEKRKAESNLYAIEDLKAAKKILMLLDGYRMLNLEDFEWADKEVKEGRMGKKFASEWKEIREILLKFAREAGSQKRLLNLAALQQILLQVGMIISAITTLLSTIGAMAFAFHLGWASFFPTVLGYAFIPLIIGLTIMFAGPPLVARKLASELEKFYERKQEFVKKANVALRIVVQKIIYSVIEAIKTGKVEIKKKKDYEIGIFHLDYEGIKVVKNPSFLRKYYIVIPEI